MCDYNVFHFVKCLPHMKKTTNKSSSFKPQHSQNRHTDTPTMSILQRLRLESSKSFLLYRA